MDMGGSSIILEFLLVLLQLFQHFLSAVFCLFFFKPPYSLAGDLQFGGLFASCDGTRPHNRLLIILISRNHWFQRISKKKKAPLKSDSRQTTRVH